MEQQYCVKCGELTRENCEYCVKCGARLLPKNYYSMNPIKKSLEDKKSKTSSNSFVVKEEKKEIITESSFEEGKEKNKEEKIELHRDLPEEVSPSVQNVIEQKEIEKKENEKKPKKILVAIIVVLVVILAIVGSLAAFTDVFKKGKEVEGKQMAKPTEVPTPTPVVLSMLPKYSQVKVGNTIEFGQYEQDNITSNGKENIKWLVLAKKNGKILVISDKALDCQKYNTTYTVVTWENCSLRKWMNGTFLNNAFSAEEQTIIQNTTVSADMNPNISTSPGNATTDKVFLLSITEFKKYFASEEADLKCVPTAYAIAQGTNTSSGCWLRSPGSTPSRAAIVYYSGSINYSGDRVSSGNVCVRPALWINLES